jgi:hypothetical protein
MTQGFSGVGLVTSFTRTGAGNKGLGTRWGNCPKFEVAPSPNSVERNSSMDVARSPLRRMTQATQLQVTVVTDEFNKANVALATQARVDEVAADAATTINFVFSTGALVGTVLSVPQQNINTLVVTDSTGSPKTLVLGTNYTVDLFSGDILLTNLTTGGPYVQPFKAAYKKGAVTVLGGLTISAPELWLSISGTNVDNGLRFGADVYRVRLDPTKLIGYINSEYQDFELTGTALLDPTKLVSDVGGQIFRTYLPDTHE